jgi:uncharacterized membrane protein
MTSLAAISFYDIVKAVHISAVVIGFGVTFTYPLINAYGQSKDPQLLPHFHRMQSLIGKRIISPFLGLIVVSGLYLVIDQDAWKFSQAFISVGLAVAIVLGALGGLFFSPSEEKLAELAERDLAAPAGDSPRLSAEYLALAARVRTVGVVSSAAVLVVILLMVEHTGL